MKFGKELTSQMVPEWQETYMDYEYLKIVLKDVHHFKQRNKPSSTINPPGLTRKLTLYRAFSGLTVQQRSPTTNDHEADIESHPILVSTVKKSDGEEGYRTRFLMTAEEGGEYELVFFRRLDDEFNKVVRFYRAKVEEVMKGAAVLNTQMDALIAFRIKVDKPQHSWFHSSTVDMTSTTRIASAVAASAAALSASKSSGIRGVSRRVPHMDIIEEDRSVRRVQSDISSSSYALKQAEPLNQSVQQLSSSSSRPVMNNSTREMNRPAPLEILERVTINKPVETPRSTIKGILNVPIQTELKFSKENLNKLEDQLKKAFIEFYHKLRLLKSYSFLNILAFSKIMKKYDKITSRDASKSYMNMVDNSYLGSSDEVTKLMDRVEVAFIKHFSNSNRKKGLSTLRPKPKRDTHAVTASVGFLAGCTVALIIALALIIRTRHILEKDGAPKYMETMFPLYSLFAFVVLHMLLYAGNIYLWRRYRVNYPFIFGFKAATALGYREVLFLSFGLAVLALGSVIANLDMEMDPKTGDYKAITELLPLGLVVLVVVILICPFKIIYRSSRFFLLTCLFHCVCAPLYKVALSDFILADQLTSQVQAFRSLEFYICYYTSADYKHRENNCNINDVYNTFNFIVAAIPFWFRLLQALRRGKDGMQGWNALKYFSIIVAVTTRTAYTRSQSNEWKIIAWIASGIAAIGSTYWDLVLDWGLLQPNSSNPWLRDKLLVPHKSVYFAAMVLNVLLRLAWVQTVLDFEVSFLHKESLITIVASLEIIRRGVWNFFRLENEHLYNVGKYRAFKSVPLPFNYDEGEDDDEDKD